MGGGPPVPLSGSAHGICVDSPETLPFADAISIDIPCADKFFFFYFHVHRVPVVCKYCKGGYDVETRFPGVTGDALTLRVKQIEKGFCCDNWRNGDHFVVSERVLSCQPRMTVSHVLLTKLSGT